MHHSTPSLARRSFLAQAGIATLGAAAIPTRIRAANPVVRLGYVESLSGPLADIGALHRAGVAAAVAEANKRGRVKFEVIEADDAGRPAEGATAARRLIEQDKVDALIAGTSSGVGLAMMPIAEAAGIFNLCINPSDTAITGTKAMATTYRFVSNVHMFVTALSRNVLALGKKWYFLSADFAYGKDIYARMSALLKNAGGTEVGADFFPLGSIDYSGLLTKVRNSGADVLVVAQGGGDTLAICRQFVELGMQKTMRICGPSMEDTWGETLPLDALAGSPFGIHWTPNASPAAPAMAARMRPFLPGPIRQRHYLGFVATSQLIDRMNAAGSTKTDAILAAFANHAFDAGKEHRSVWRGCDHQCIQDTYAMAITNRATYKKTGSYLRVVSVAPGEDSAGSCNDTDAAAARATLAGQKVPDRSGYEVKSLR